ncbi:MAG: Clp protease N-terminal domain-containing protein [Planctomycetaceae bacterium]
MYEYLTDAVRKTMMAASEHADHFKHDYVGCLHMLLGAIDIAPETLESKSVDVAQLRGSAINQLEHAQSSGGKAAIESALEQARLHESSVVDVAHLLVGILSRPDDAVKCVFDDLHLDMDDVRRRLSDDLGTR